MGAFFLTIKMKLVNIYSQKERTLYTRTRQNETKLGEDVLFIESERDWVESLRKLNCRYVLLGIPEDIGVRANYGRGGAHTAWKPALESFLSQQSNAFLSGKSIAVLGHIEVDDLMNKADKLNQKSKSDIQGLRLLVSEIDNRVSEVITQIIQCGKLPIIIGGGHNNAYPIIKGVSQAKAKPINVINCDPHSDFRTLEGRHSGNGFSYAFQENYINKYSVFCMHEQYNTQKVLEDFTRQKERLFFNTYEDVFVRENRGFSETLKQNIGFVKTDICGVEIDLDAITNVPSSAKTSSGISPVQARQYVYQCGKQLNAQYLHIAEGAPILSHIKADNKTGKLIAYLIADFIKGCEEKNY